MSVDICFLQEFPQMKPSGQSRPSRFLSAEKQLALCDWKFVGSFVLLSELSELVLLKGRLYL